MRREKEDDIIRSANSPRAGRADMSKKKREVILFPLLTDSTSLSSSPTRVSSLSKLAKSSLVSSSFGGSVVAMPGPWAVAVVGMIV